MFMDVKFTLILFACTRAAELEIEGELSFFLKMPDGLGTKRASQVTAGSVVECVYQFPEQPQVDAILSNMMNVLTKVFVRTSELFSRERGRRQGEGSQRARSRFQVVDHKTTQFFESIYHNMTDEFNEFYNSTAQRVARARSSPCEHQEEMKQAWRELLARAEATWARAARYCLQEQMNTPLRPSPGAPTPAPPPARLRARVHAVLTSELGKLRGKQLHLLCDHFQLCYYDLL